MIPIFINSEDTFDVKFVAALSKTNVNIIYVDVDLHNLKLQGGEDLGTVEEHTVVFRFPNYGDSTKILDNSIKFSGADISLSPADVRQKRMLTLLKSWDFKGKDGKPIEPTAENIINLHPLIAAVITIQLDKELENRRLL